METLVDRIMRSRPQHPTPGDTVAAAPANDRAEVEIIENPAGPQPTAAPAIQSQGQAVVNPLYVNPPATTSLPKGGGGRGGYRGRGRGAQRGGNNKGNQNNQVQVPSDRPVRCSHLTATGT